MEREDTERRFRDEVRSFRREYVWFAGGAALVSVGIAVALGWLLYMFLTILSTQLLMRMELIPVRPFIAIYAVAFIVIGYAQYRRRAAPSEDDDWIELLGKDPGGTVGFALGGLLFSSFPALIFHFAHEVLTGRHAFASEEVERLAFEVLADGGEKISADFLQAKLREQPDRLRPALQLLIEMRLLSFHTHEGERHLLQTLRGTEILKAEKLEESES